MDVDLPSKYNLGPVETGIFIISLDFELFWGVRDHRTLADYGANILGVRKSIPAMLEMFRRHSSLATPENRCLHILTFLRSARMKRPILTITASRCST
jgi:hypothetical protein